MRSTEQVLKYLEAEFHYDWIIIKTTALKGVRREGGPNNES